MNITDTQDLPLSSIPITLTENTDSPVVVIRVPCQERAYLAAPSGLLAQVFARRTGSGESFTDIGLSPVDLTPFAGQTIDFDVMVHASNISVPLAQVALTVRVTSNP